MLFETFTLCILGIYSCHNACHFCVIMPASPYSIMGNCFCRRRPRFPEQSTAEEQHGPVVELILIDRNCIAQAPANTGSTHSVLVGDICGRVHKITLAVECKVITDVFHPKNTMMVQTFIAIMRMCTCGDCGSFVAVTDSS